MIREFEVQGIEAIYFSDVLCSVHVLYDRRQAYYPPYKYKMGTYINTRAKEERMCRTVAVHVAKRNIGMRMV